MEKNKDTKLIESVNTGGGPYVGKDVSTGRDFVGRDVNITSNNWYKLESESENPKSGQFPIAIGAAIIISLATLAAAFIPLFIGDRQGSPTKQAAILTTAHVDLQPTLTVIPTNSCQFQSLILGRWSYNSMTIVNNARPQNVGPTIEFLNDGTYIFSGPFYLPVLSTSLNITDTSFIIEPSTDSVQSGTFALLDCSRVKRKLDGDTKFDVFRIEKLDNEQLNIAFLNGTNITYSRQ